MLGIKLEIDKTSIKQASKSLRGGIDRGAQRARRTLGLGGAAGAVVGAEVGMEGEPKKGKKDANGAFSGAAIGGLIGAVVGSLKPIQELLGVVAGILQIFMVPVMILLKPFLVLFLKVGMLLMKAFTTAPGETDIEKKTNKFGTVIGVIIASLAGLAAFFAGAGAVLIAGLVVAFFFVGKYLFEAFVLVGNKLMDAMNWVVENIIIPIYQWMGEKIKAIGESLIAAWNWVKNAAKVIWNWIVVGFKAVLDFGSKIWDFFLTGLSFIGNLGSMLWDWLKNSLKSIADLGSKIWGYIKSALRSLVGSGGRETSVNDALITSQGSIVHLNPNDNVLAFQNFSQINNLANSAGGGSTGRINIIVNGFVGNDQDLANKVAKALNKASRGSVSNFG